MKPYVFLLTAMVCLNPDPANAQNDPNPGQAPVSTTKSPPAPTTTPDGKVTGLNTKSYAALKAIKARNLGAFTDADAKVLKEAVMAEGGIDAIERDLLDEMVQSQFRSITIISENAAAGEKLISYPVSGNAKQTLINTLNPPIDFDVEWAKGQPGWQAIVTEYRKSSAAEPRVINFVQLKLAQAWLESNMENGYKPLRNEIGKLYGYSNSLAAADVNTGRTILYRSMEQMDRNSADAIPDFLYNWVRPGGYL